jgi:alkylation response protein AidB-like acyl-CoA dehydrogenase
MTLEAPRIPERDALLKAAAGVAAVVSRNADRAEELRRLPEETVAALDEAGLFSFMRPREVGGVEADPVTQHEVIERIARADASAAWCSFIGAGSSAFAAAMVPDAGFDEIRSAQPAGRPWPRFAGVPTPSGRAQPVAGGYRLSGRWGWASGIHHSDWVFAGGIVAKDGTAQPTEIGMPLAQVCVLPRTEVTLEDTWDTMGLRGTGSTHFSCDDVFVPEHRSFPFPSPVAQRGGALFRLPLLGFFGPAFSGFPQGVGRRALDEVLALALRKTRVGHPTTISERGVFRRDVGAADGRLRSASALVRGELGALWQRLHDGVDESAVDSARLLQAFTNNAEAALDVSEMAYRHGGGDALYRTSPLQRSLRDMRTASQHILVGEHNHEALGAALLEAHPEGGRS